MAIIWDILLQTVDIMTLVFGILGLAFSLMLAFSPAIVQNIGKLMNRQIDIDKNLAVLDQEIATENLVYSHPAITGILLIAGSAFALVFFFFKLDISNFAMIFLGSNPPSEIGEILFLTLVWISKVACIVGFICGVCLILAPRKMRGLEARIGAWVETRTTLEKLNRDNHSLDSLLYRHPLLFGTVGVLVSFSLIVLSILNLLD